VEGFGGFSVEDGMPCFNAKLPERWSSLRFKLHFRGRLIEVYVNQGTTDVRRLEGDPLEINVNGQVTAL
jgi:alpha,alpha-trehalose phosphorylase